MAKRKPKEAASQALERISQIRQALAALDYVCSGTLLHRMMKCGKPSCRCQIDPDARHGPYFQWGHLKSRRLVHRYLSADQASLVRKAIANYRGAKKLLRAWERETERLIDAQMPPKT